MPMNDATCRTLDLLKCQRCAELAAQWIEPIRAKAREMGYAIGVHGSLARDIDLIACPWTYDAASPEKLAGSLLELTGGHLSWSMQGREFTLAGCPGDKPHGRLGWVINLDGGVYIDLSVMPRKGWHG